MLLDENLMTATKMLTADEILEFTVLNADETRIGRAVTHIIALKKVLSNLQSHLDDREENLQKVVDELREKGYTDNQIQCHRGVIVRKDKIIGLKALIEHRKQELEDLHQACAYA